MIHLLDECYNFKESFDDINNDIIEIETALYYPRNQVITDMPRGGATGNAVDNLLTKLEGLKAEREMLKAEHNAVWNEILKKLNSCGASENVKKLFELRSCQFYQWKDCAPIMAEFTGEEWNVSKVYRIRRAICEKCTDI